MKVTVVIVTYADRFHLLKLVIESCFKSNVNNVVVIDNNSELNSKNQLKNLLKNNAEKLKVKWNSSNLGSAKAYKQGLEIAKEIDNEYVWLLDDDNKPRENALCELIEFWVTKSKNVGALLSYRPDRDIYKRAVLEKNSKLVLGAKNSFSRFHFLEKIINLFTPKTNVNNDLSFGDIAYAPYGGMFFEKSLLNKIGYPNEDFFLYSDDHDWSYRITQSGMKIQLILNSVIDDIDTSWAIKESNNNVFKRIKNAPSFRVYYTVRNRITFEKQYLISNKIVYQLNKWIFTIFFGLYGLRSKNFKVYLRAIKDAENSNLVKF